MFIFKCSILADYIFELRWPKFRLEENKSRFVFPAQLPETDKYYHSPSLAVFPLLCSFKFEWRLSEDSNSCLCQQTTIGSRLNWLVGEMAATLNCRCYCSIKRSLNKCLVRSRRLEVRDIHVENARPPQSLFINSLQDEQIQNTNTFLNLSNIPFLFIYIYLYIFDFIYKVLSCPHQLNHTWAAFQI